MSELGNVLPVSGVLRKLADMLDSGAATSGCFHITSTGPVMIDVQRIGDKDPTYVSHAQPGQLQRFSLSCDVTTEMSTIRSALEP